MFRRYFPQEYIYLHNWFCRQNRHRASFGTMGVNIFRYYRPWKKSLRNSRVGALTDDKTPWITYPAIDFLQSQLSSDMHVFEYGSGASTAFFAKHVRHVISIENDPLWGRTVSDLLRAKKITNVDLRIIESDRLEKGTTIHPENPDFYHSNSEKYNMCDFKKYVSQIDQLKDGSMDVVFVDGRSRAACIKHAYRKVKPGGMLLLDNSERVYYTQESRRFVENWEERIFFGPVSSVTFFTETTCWTAPY